MNQVAMNSEVILAASPEETYQALRRNLRRRKGFGLLFVRCSPGEGDKLINNIREDLPSKKIEYLRLDKSIDNLYEIVEQIQEQKQIDVLFVGGIEKSFVDDIKPGIGGQGDYYKTDSVPRLLNHLNLQRERFRDKLNICFVFLVPRFALKYFVRRAPDFFDWRSGVFEFPTDKLQVELESFRIVLEGDYQKYLTWTNKERHEKILAIKEVITEAHQTTENKVNLWFEIGNIYFAGGEYEEAISSYDQALQFKPDKDQAWNNRGNALGNLGRYEEAISSYDQALQFKPEDDQAWYNRGVDLGNLGRYEEAISSYDQALQFKPEDDQAWNNRGVALGDLGRYEEAISSYDQAWYNRGVALGNLGRYEEAISSFDQALQFKPEDDEAWNNRGVALGNLGRYEEAISSYDQALQFKPEDDQAWNNRGVALGNLGRYEEAISSYDQALQFKPDNDQAWYNRGVALGNLGRYEEAISSYDQALQFKPDNDQAWYNKACSYALQGRVELAIEHLQQAIKLNPDHYREMAKTDSDFNKIREDERFKALC